MTLMEWLCDVEWRIRKKFQYSKEAQMEKLEVGTRVKLINSNHPIAVYEPVGSIGTINSKSAEILYVQFDSGAHRGMKASQIEVIKQPKEAIMADSKFKVGDRVRIIHSSPSKHDGEFCRVTQVEKHRVRVDVGKNEMGEDWIVYIDGTGGDKIELLGNTLDGLAVGDQVEKTKEDATSTTFGPYTHTFTIGYSDRRGSKRTVLATLAPGVYALSKTEDQEEFGQVMTVKDLERKGYTIVGEQ